MPDAPPVTHVDLAELLGEPGAYIDRQPDPQTGGDMLYLNLKPQAIQGHLPIVARDGSRLDSAGMRGSEPGIVVDRNAAGVIIGISIRWEQT